MQTITFYNENATPFIDTTLNVDFSHVQNRFLDKLHKESFILDFGCGSGRDTKYFMDQGHTVEAVDGSIEMCKLASEYTGIEVKNMYFQDLQEVDKYDAIWACSSILHLPYPELVDVMKKMSIALKEKGFIYTSFKYGTYEGVRNSRYFTDMTEESTEKLLQEIPELQIDECWITSDVRPGRGEEKWLNLILQKVDIQ